MFNLTVCNSINRSIFAHSYKSIVFDSTPMNIYSPHRHPVANLRRIWFSIFQGSVSLSLERESVVEIGEDNVI